MRKNKASNLAKVNLTVTMPDIHIRKKKGQFYSHAYQGDERTEKPNAF